MTGIIQDASPCVTGAEKHPFSPTPIALESAANVAFGHAKDDVVRAAEALRRDLGSSSWTTIATLAGLCAALDRLKALDWPNGPERAGTALAGSGEAPGWRPIQTAPKDGTRVIIGLYASRSCVWVSEDGWDADRDEWSDLGGNDGPTHWMALPDPPTGLTGPGDGG